MALQQGNAGSCSLGVDPGTKQCLQLFNIHCNSSLYIYFDKTKVEYKILLMYRTINLSLAFTLERVND